MDCQYCKKTFNNKYTLGQHQKTAKYCLDLQGTTNTTFTCSYCNKNLCTNDRLYTHYQSCKEKQKVEVVKDVETENKQLKEKLQEKNEYISKLEAKLEKMEAKLEAKLEKLESTVTTIALEAKTVSAKPVTTNNTTNHITVTTNTNNFLNLSKEHVNKVLKDNMDCRLGDVCRREDIDGFRWEVDVLLRRSESPDV